MGPWLAVILAVTFLFCGTSLLIVGCLMVLGLTNDVHYQDRFLVLIVMGSIMFIPGSYYTTYFACKAFTRDPDWKYDELLIDIEMVKC